VTLTRRRLLLLGLLASVCVLATVAWTQRTVLASLAGSTDGAPWILDVRAARPLPDETRWLDGPGPRLSLDLYRPPGEGDTVRDAILLVHGNRRQGARDPLYRLLARRLAQRGCLVAALSLRGYGPSEAAPADRAVTARDLLDDVERGRDAVEAMVDGDWRLGLVGHSIGSILALRADPRPRWRRVALGPGRRLRSRVVDPPAPELEAFRWKLRANLRGGVKDRETVRALYRDLDPERRAEAVEPGTLLVIQEARIPPEDLESTRRVAAARENTELVLLDTADHEYGVTTLGGFVLYPERLISELTETTLGFVRGDGTGTDDDGGGSR
jgi:pimeloyl-ACP methyl ester carboxylesterase